MIHSQLKLKIYTHNSDSAPFMDTADDKSLSRINKKNTLTHTQITSQNNRLFID